jgi:hypothetical protein
MSLVPGALTVHPRSAWVDPAFPITGPIDDPANNDVVVIHYTAADNLIDGDPGEHASNLPAYLRAMQKEYVTKRGYSVGYLFAVDWLGGIWQIRGWAFESAANKGHNHRSFPILMLVDGADRATPEAVRSVRHIVTEAQRRAGRTLSIKGHGQLRVETGIGTATACPGKGLQAQVNAGDFMPRSEPTPPPPPPSKKDDPAMLFLEYVPGTPGYTGFCWDGVHLAWIFDGHAAAVLAKGEVKRVTVDRTQLASVIRSSRTTTSAPPTIDSQLRAAWEAQQL